MIGLEPGAKRVTKTPCNMLDKAEAMPDLQFKEFMDPTEKFNVGQYLIRDTQYSSLTLSNINCNCDNRIPLRP